VPTDCLSRYGCVLETPCLPMAFVLSGEMMLWEAVSNRDLPEVRRLLAKGGGDPNMLCPDSFVRLHASEKFRAGQAQNTGRSLLHHAAWAGDLEVFKAIVDAGGDIDRKRNTVWRPNGGVNGRGNSQAAALCRDCTTAKRSSSTCWISVRTSTPRASRATHRCTYP
jgi:hypothetical protein